MGWGLRHRSGNGTQGWQSSSSSHGKKVRWVPAGRNMGVYFSEKGRGQVRQGREGQGREMSSSFWSSVLRSSRKRVGVRMCEEPGQENGVGGAASAPDTPQVGCLGNQALTLRPQKAHPSEREGSTPR